MAFKYSAAFRRATLGGENSPDGDFSEAIIGLFQPGTTDAEKKTYWKERGEKERAMLARNSWLVTKNDQ